MKIRSLLLSTTPLLFLATPGVISHAAEPALTIYNANFAVVRERVPLDLAAGVSKASFSGATMQVEPDSVVLRDPQGKAKFQILEQSYRNDPVDQDLLLKLYEGKTIDFQVSEPNKPDRTVTGKVIRSGVSHPVPIPIAGGAIIPGIEPVPPVPNQPIIEVEGKLRFALPGLPLFPTLADDTVLKPTLSWQISSEAAAKVDAELSYVTGGFSWQADYNLVAPEKGDTMDLVGWVTMKNNSGQGFTEAKIKLMAGDPRKIQPPQPLSAPAGMAVAVDAAVPERTVTEKTFDEFHLYTLERPATLRDRESKQVEFIRAVGVQAKRIYEYIGFREDWHAYDPEARRQRNVGEQSMNKKVRVLVDVKNSEENHLGQPLPKGRVRFYRQDGAALEFTGEDEIDHTPKDETLHFYTGDAFELTGERKRTKFKIDETNHWIDETYEITLRNHKKEPVEIRVKEPMFRSTNWQIRKPSIAFTQKDSETVEFLVPIKPDEEKKLTYEVHYTW